MVWPPIKFHYKHVKAYKIIAAGATLALIFHISCCNSLMKPYYGKPVHALPPANSPTWNALQELRSDDDWFSLLDHGPKAAEWRIRCLDSATSSIDLQSFLLGDDPVSKELIRRLLLAADRGVRVRMLMDDSFLQKKDPVLHAIDAHANIDFRVYNPYGRRSGGSAMRTLLNLGDFSRVDHRMHNKLLVIDNRVAIVGGRNLADEYYGHDSAMNFRDLEVLTGGVHVRVLSDAFDQYWNDHWSIPAGNLPRSHSTALTLDSYRKSLKPFAGVLREEADSSRQSSWLRVCRSAVGGYPSLLVDRPPVKNPAASSEAPVQVAHELRKLIDSADSEVVLISAYLIPTAELEAAIERAESRGVQVRILTNSLRSNNHTAAHASYRRHIKRLVDHGADLHELRADGKDRSRHMRGEAGDRSLALHAKALILDDDKVFIGSCNLDARSLRINTEMGLVIESREFNAQLREAMRLDFDKRNAWHVQRRADGGLVWVGDDHSRDSQPAGSPMQRIEDWIFSLLPIEGEM